MNFATDTTEATKKLSDACEDLEAKVANLQSAVEYGEKLLSKLINPTIRAFIHEWSQSEMDRLSKLRMDLLIDDRDSHIIISAQYDAAKNFGEEPEKIQITVDENRRALMKAQDALMEKRSKLKKLKG